jgi:hypothetical protein
MKLAASLFVVCLSIVGISGYVHAQKNAPGLAGGRWAGRADAGDAKSYSVTVILDGNGTGFIEYPSMKCGGTLHFVRKNGEAFLYREAITHGQSKCGASGQVELIPDGADLTWTRLSAGTHASATLSSVQSENTGDCTSCEISYDQSVAACYRNPSMDDRQKCLDRAEDDLHTCEGICKE